ncbi:MAG TPA: iron chelate uptake ABC transporter family permease subunit [Polyangiaceae bacterium]|nr:iron chelate uptake ABC transporter family permease subunit [Polyangiaceae bacterium]
MSRRAPARVLGMGALAVLTVAFVSVWLGAAHLAAEKVLRILLHAAGFAGTDGSLAWERTIVLDVRLPRVVTGAFVGAALAVSGAALQALFRNPLADPGVIGVSSGASLGAVLAMQLGLSAMERFAVPAFAIVGAAGTALAVYGIASRRGTLPVGTLLLAGVAVGSLASALTSLLLSLSLDEYEQGRQTVRWLMGGLEARTWSEVAIVAPTTLIGAALVVASSRELDALLLGEREALALGVDVPVVRRRLVFATAVVVGGAVAVSGVIGFVGLVVPHLLRLLVGPSHRLLLPACLLFGAAFVVATDLLCRTVAAPEEIRLGVMTGSLGAPFFLFLLLSRRKEIALE